MKHKKYYLKINTSTDPEMAKLLERRLPKNGLSLGEFRRIKGAVNLLFPEVEVKIISSENRRPKINIL